MTSPLSYNPNLRLPFPTSTSGVYSPPRNYVLLNSPSAESARSSSSGYSSPSTTSIGTNLPSLNLTTSYRNQSPPLQASNSSLGPLAALVTLPPLPRAGRKPLTTPPKDNRQRQNREAQRVYRRNQKEEMQALREKEMQWIRTAREGRTVIEDILRLADTMPLEYRQHLDTYGLERFFDELAKYTGGASPTAQSPSLL
jgi:hypothetical protein